MNIPPGWPGMIRVDEPEPRIPVVRPRALARPARGPARPPAIRRAARARERLHARREIRVAQHDDDRAERLGESARGDHRVEALLDRRRRDDDPRRVARLREERGEQIGLLDFCRESRARSAALHVDHDERRLRHDRRADELRLEREARAPTSR